MKNKLYLSILLFITVILTAIGVIAFRKQSEEVTASNAYFDINNSSGFYEEDISIEIKVPKKCRSVLYRRWKCACQRICEFRFV